MIVLYLIEPYLSNHKSKKFGNRKGHRDPPLKGKKLVCFGKETWIRIKEVLRGEVLERKGLARMRPRRLKRKRIRRKPELRHTDVDIVRANGNGWSDGFDSFRTAPLREMRIDDSNLAERWRRVKEYTTQINDDSWDEKMKIVKQIISDGKGTA